MRFTILCLCLPAFFGCLSACLHNQQLSRRALAVPADELKGKDVYGEKLNDRAIRTPWTTILDGLLRSQNFASVAASIPCDIVNTLETNAEAAEQFVREVQAGQIPTIIENLPQEIVDAFGSIINAALALPQSIWDTAVNVVDGVEGVFDSIADGSIISELPAEIAGAWDAVTADIACLFDDCPEPTPGGCASSTPASVCASATPIVYPNTTSAVYSYNWALSSAVAAASSAAHAQVTASQSSLHPVAIGTSIVFVQPTYTASPSSLRPSQSVPSGASETSLGRRVIWTFVGTLTMGALVVWL